ncbi:hypothetical protein LMH73_016935 [Vibrio splendidus]|nr:hypothetical protein [Vibrio splendidus]MCC4881843.1 hypothetical protein [Vibrio splendidus]
MNTFNDAKQLFINRDLIDLHAVIHELVDFTNINRDSIKAVNNWLSSHSCQYNQTKVIMYHGTLSSHDIEEQGIKRTTSKTKRSLQSEPGFVYLSLFASSAKTFAEMAYPNQAVSVYAVEVPVRDMKADLDQLKNARIWKALDFDVKSTVGDSLVIGSGIRLKRDVHNYELRLLS